jgi:hypothetical protein
VAGRSPVRYLYHGFQLISMWISSEESALFRYFPGKCKPVPRREH